MVPGLLWEAIIFVLSRILRGPGGGRNLVPGLSGPVSRPLREQIIFVLLRILRGPGERLGAARGILGWAGLVAGLARLAGLGWWLGWLG